MTKSLNYSEVIGGDLQDYEKVGKVSSLSVQKHTGKDWRTWIQLLEKVGARNLTYQEIVAHLRKKHRLTPWWQHGVALGFEIATGRRRVGEDARGKYMVTATKSLPIGVKTVWKKMLSSHGMKLWLRPMSPLRMAPKSPFETTDGYFGEIRTMVRDRRIRMCWQNPFWKMATILEILFVPRPGKKSILVFNHTGIADEKTREILRVRWREAVDSIAHHMKRNSI